MLKIGDKMPHFEVVDQDGQTVRSEDFIGKGRKTIIYQGQYLGLHGRSLQFPGQLCRAHGAGLQRGWG